MVEYKFNLGSKGKRVLKINSHSLLVARSLSLLALSSTRAALCAAMRSRQSACGGSMGASGGAVSLDPRKCRPHRVHTLHTLPWFHMTEGWVHDLAGPEERRRCSLLTFLVSAQRVW